MLALLALTLCSLLHLPALLQLLHAPALPAQQGLDISPRTCPSASAILCAYYRWFSRLLHLVPY